MTRTGLQRPSEGQSRHDLQHADATDGNPLGLQDLPSPSPPKLWRWTGLFAFVLISMAMLATLIVVTAAKDKKAALLQAEEKRLRQSVDGRVKILETWLDGQHSISRRLTDSYVFRLFVADLIGHDPKVPLPRSLRDQRPYFLQLMADFARQNGLARAAVLRRNGSVVLSSPGPALPVSDILRQLEDAKSDGNLLLSPIRRADEPDAPLVVDVVVPVPEVQAENRMTSTPSAVLAFTVPVDRLLEGVLSSRNADADDEKILLLQERGDLIDRFWMTREGIELAAAPSSGETRAATPISFGRRGDNMPVYSLGEPVEGASWAVVHALDARATLSPVHGFIKASAGLSVAAVLALTAAFSAAWWRQGRNHHRRLAELYQAHARRVDHQRQFLQSVTRSIGDWLTVSSADGTFIYANPAFQAMIGSPETTVSRKKWGDLVKELPADRASADDLVSLIDAAPFGQVEIGGDLRVVSSHVSDLRAEDGSVQGTVRVVRDHTQLVAERRQRLRSLTQTVDALVHAIELRDPFLLGHTDRVRGHAIAVGRRLDLAHRELASLALAASLSQIGKIFIPDHVLAKPGRHNAEEEVIMRGHSLHAIDILERIDFDLPIVDILAQMHERLDGSGYPHGLAGDQIGLSARILGVADVFCARTSPRSYRDRISAGKTLYHLANNGERYDLKVVAALAEIVGHGPGIDSPEPAEQTFPDSGIWQQKRQGCHPVRETAS